LDGRPPTRPRAGADQSLVKQRQNVAALSASVSASLPSQFNSLTIAPSGTGRSVSSYFAITWKVVVISASATLSRHS